MRGLYKDDDKDNNVMLMMTKKSHGIIHKHTIVLFILTEFEGSAVRLYTYIMAHALLTLVVNQRNCLTRH